MTKGAVLASLRGKGLNHVSILRLTRGCLVLRQRTKKGHGFNVQELTV